MSEITRSHSPSHEYRFMSSLMATSANCSTSRRSSARSCVEAHSPLHEVIPSFSSALFDAPARTDPVHIVLLVQSAVPTALSVNSIFQREGVDTSSLGRLMLPMYAFAMPSIVGMMVLDVLVA